MTCPPEFLPVPPGSRIALVAPASPPSPDLLDRAIEMLREWGYEVVEGDYLRSIDTDLPYLAGTDEQRAHDVQQALCDEDVDAVICARGGYGSARILPLLDPQAIHMTRAKPFFGSSDITSLHTWMFERCGRGGWFAPMPATVAVLDDAKARRGLRDALAGGLVQRRSTRITSPYSEGSRPWTRVRGRIRGGNLSLLAENATGCEHHGFEEPTIALLEDVHEPAYHIDGLIRQLMHVGWFHHVVAIALGSWLDCADEALIRCIMHRNLDDFGIPIVSGFDFGHGPGASTVPLGVMGDLSVTTSGTTLRWSGHAVEKTQNVCLRNDKIK